METYSLNKYDFKNFLLKELTDTYQVELIFWKKTIPMPVDIVYSMFEKRGELLKKYIDHIGAAYVFSYIHKLKGVDWTSALGAQPTKENLINQRQLLSEVATNLHRSNAPNMLKEIADKLLLYNYEINETRIVAALCHEGRKYKRLYIPSAIREIIVKFDIELLNHIARNNGDMFSNVVADELKIYRMGFADAFSGIFNKLIDFVLTFSLKGKKGYANASDIKLINEKDLSSSEKELMYGVVLDGSLWEPRYINGQSRSVLNEEHPYIAYVKRLGKKAELVLADLANSMSEVENEIVKESDRRLVEITRQELSRKLRIKAENLITENSEAFNDGVDT